MSELNHIKLLDFPQAELVGFKEVKGFIYVSISRVSPLIVIYSKKIEEREYRFRVRKENYSKSKALSSA